MIWQNPWAWAGLGVLVLPVLIHLLSRAPAARRPFPSLRFIDASQLPPRRQTRVHDPLLLAVRLGILLAAVAALARPLLHTGGQRATGTRVARAIVVDTSASMRRPVRGSSGTTADTGSGITLLDSARRIAAASAVDAAVSTVVMTRAPGAALTGIAGWLGAQRGAHEMVIVSDFQQGTIDSLALAALPAAYGVRFVRLDAGPMPTTFTARAAHPASHVAVQALPERTGMAWRTEADTAQPPVDDGVVPVSFLVHAGADDEARAVATLGALGAPGGTSRAGTPPGAGDTLRVRLVYRSAPDADALRERAAAPSTRPLATLIARLAMDPVLRSAARRERAVGMPPLGATDTSRVVVARGAHDAPVVLAAADGQQAGALLLFCHAAPGSAVSTALIAAVLRAASLPGVAAFAEREPVMLSDETLQRWTRSATDTAGATYLRTAANGAAGDAGSTESDGRWLWVVALLLLGVEWLLRRRGDPAAAVERTIERAA